MKKIKLILSIFLVIFLCKEESQAENHNYSFKAGEKCEYNLYYNWGFIWINAVKVDFTVKEKRYKNFPAFELQMASKTNKAFSLLTMRDTLTSYVKQKNLEPLTFIQTIHEDNYFAINKFDYFYEKNLWGVQIEKERKKGVRHETFVSEKRFYDVITTLYKLRNIDVSKLKPNQKIPMPLVFDDGIYDDLYLRYVGKETIKLKNGDTYQCLKLKPLLAEGKMFEKGEGMTIWVSDDKNLIPIMVESKLKVGSIKAILTNTENLKFPMISLK